MATDLPVACEMGALTKAERSRQAELLAKVRSRLASSEELADGYALRFPAEPTLFVEAAEWIALERRCCRFASFEIAWRDDASFSVRVTGPQGARDVFAAEMGLRAPSSAAPSET